MADEPNDLHATLAGYAAPQMESRSFNCPYCAALALQSWYELEYSIPGPKTVRGLSGPMHLPLSAPDRRKYQISVCMACKQPAFWLGDRLLYPHIIAAPGAPADLPDDCRADYEEARRIAQDSPRSACALLRSGVVERIVRALLAEESMANLNDGIGKLYTADKIGRRTKEAMDAVRLAGNGIHPEALNAADNAATAQALFKVVHFLVNDAITGPREVKAIHDLATPGQRAAMERRDKPASKPPPSP